MPSLGENQPQERTLLITGAAGFLGRRLVADALAQGAQVIAVVRPRGRDGRSQSDAFAGFPKDRLTIERADLSQPQQVSALFERLQARHVMLDGVVHAAAMLGNFEVGSDDALQQQHANVDATQLLAHDCERYAAQQGKPIAFHYVSSTSALSYEHAIAAGQANPNLSYDRTKYEASSALKQSASAWPHLAVSISYPGALVSESPSQGVPSRLLRGEEILRPNEQRCMSYIGNATQDMLDALKPGACGAVQEFGIHPDYVLSGYQLAQLVQHVRNKEPLGEIPHNDAPAEMIPTSMPVRTHATAPSLGDLLQQQQASLQRARSA